MRFGGSEGKAPAAPGGPPGGKEVDRAAGCCAPRYRFVLTRISVHLFTIMSMLLHDVPSC